MERRDNAGMCLLYDFFGELLTERQRTCFELHYNDDLSLSEIAELEGITRQGAHVNISRAEEVMLNLEEKTGIVARFLKLREVTAKLELLLADRDEPELSGLVEQLKGIM
jgi:predicted DNA-binding protein YlxM (UPF0122 family)